MGRDGLLTLEKPDEMVNYCHDGECRGFHPPSQEATVSRPWRNAGVLRSLLTATASATAVGEGGLELRRVTPYRRCHGLLPVGLHGWGKQSLLCGESMLRKTGFEEPAGVRR